MNHTVTIGGILLTIGLLSGIALTGFGALAIFAGGMSDAPEAGADATKQGCICAVGGLVLLIGCLIGLIA